MLAVPEKAAHEGGAEEGKQVKIPDTHITSNGWMGCGNGTGFGWPQDGDGGERERERGKLWNCIFLGVTVTTEAGVSRC